MSKQNIHYTCIACITIDSVFRIDKKNHPQVYLQESKYRAKKNTNAQIHKHWIKSDSESSDSDLDLEKIETKINKELESDSD